MVNVMKVWSVNNNYKNNQNNVPFKAYIKPNAEFHILYGCENSASARLIKQLNELPNHCIEILKLNKLKNVFSKYSDGGESILDKTECIILNHNTKQTANITLENKWSPLSDLIRGIIELKDKPFFANLMGTMDSALYETMTTGKPLAKIYADTIDKFFSNK